MVELESLRKVVTDLAADLRTEKQAHRILKNEYKEAMTRGKAAIHDETLNISQAAIETERSMTSTSKQLLYSPEKQGSPSLSPTK
jgi:hypothetical protein